MRVKAKIRLTFLMALIIALANQSCLPADPPLIRAVKQGDIEKVIRALETVSVNTKPDGNTPLLMVAVQNRKEDIARLLIQKGADVNVTNNGGETPLINAAHRGLYPIVEMLLDAGANVNQASNGGYTPLMASCGRGHSEVAKLLLANGANTEAHTTNNATALIDAVTANLETVTVLLDAHANVNVQCKDGTTALMIAINHDAHKIADALIRAGADLKLQDNKGRTAYDYASHNRQMEELLSRTRQK